MARSKSYTPVGIIGLTLLTIAGLIGLACVDGGTWRPLADAMWVAVLLVPAAGVAGMGWYSAGSGWVDSYDLWAMRLQTILRRGLPILVILEALHLAVQQQAVRPDASSLVGVMLPLVGWAVVGLVGLALVVGYADGRDFSRQRDDDFLRELERCNRPTR